MRGINVPETPGFVSDVSGSFVIWGLFRYTVDRKGFPVVERTGLSHKSIWFGQVKMIVGVQLKALSTNQSDIEWTLSTANQFASPALRDK